MDGCVAVYDATNVKTDTWKHYTGLAVPVTRADSLQVRLLNAYAAGQIYFDNALLFEISVPAN
jgi:hypothetical protein